MGESPVRSWSLSATPARSRPACLSAGHGGPWQWSPSFMLSAPFWSGSGEATAKQGETVAPLVTSARLLTAVSWCTYPFVYIIKNMGLAGTVATTYEQIGYSIADVTAKAAFGVLIWAIAAEKSRLEEEGKLL